MGNTFQISCQFPAFNVYHLRRRNELPQWTYIIYFQQTAQGFFTDKYTGKRIKSFSGILFLNTQLSFHKLFYFAGSKMIDLIAKMAFYFGDLVAGKLLKLLLSQRYQRALDSFL